MFIPPIEPMKAKLSDVETLTELSNNENWGAGEKFDGSRELLYLGKNRNSLLSSLGNDNIDRVPQFQKVIPELAGTVIDCEGLAPTRYREDTASCFRSLPENAIAWQTEHGQAILKAFDIPYYCGDCLMDVILKGHRIPALKEVVDILQNRGWPIQREELVIKDKLSYYQTITSRSITEGNEGVILKNLYGVYEPGKRSNYWLKVKKGITITAVITGFTKAGPGKFENQIGAVNFRSKEGVIGCASGMDDPTRLDMTKHPRNYKGKQAYFSGQFITRGNALEHPQYKGLIKGE